jgi:hypothetical protein
MTDVIAAAESVIPMGELGLKLGMSRFELLSLSDFRLEQMTTLTELYFQLLSAFLIASLFIAKRLSSRQFYFLLSIYSVTMVWLSFNILLQLRMWEQYWRAAGLIHVGNFTLGGIEIWHGIPSILVSLVFLLGSIWWAIICRKSTTIENANPI